MLNPVDPPLSGIPPMAMIPVTKLGADGCVPFTDIDYEGCCPPPLCGNDLCCTFVAFFNILPSGPLWDYWKAAAISYFERSEDPAECPIVKNPACPSLVLHTIYTVLKLRGIVHDGLWPALRESNVYTAVTTLDDHLARLQWEDCYNQHCRSVILGEITPMEIWTECGPLFCDPEFTPELELALKRAVAIALTRANMGVIKNLCGINWIIEPLGAALVPVYSPRFDCIDPPDPPYPDNIVPCVDPPVPEDCCEENTTCSDTAFKIIRTRDWIEGVGSGDICDTLLPRPKIPSDGSRGCDKPAGLPDLIWPGVLAAECIVRSLMPPTCPTNITREC
jgi:hypothetical protein